MVDVTIFLALVAGLVAFLSPCILPVVPSYVTMISGISYRDLSEGRYKKTTILTGSLAFILGFTVVFVSMGVILSTTSILIGGFSNVVNKIAGSIVILFGINYIFDLIRILNIEKRVHLKLENLGFGGSFLIGATFGAGWTPCIGPVLSTVLIMAGTAGNISNGIILLTAFSLGLGIPFLLTGLFFMQSQAAMKSLKRHMMAIKRVGGVLMILIGILIFNGALLQFNGTLFGWAYELESWSQDSPGASRWIISILFLFLGVVFAWPLVRHGIDRQSHAVEPIEKTPSGAEKSRSIHWKIISGAISLMLVLVAAGTFLGVLDPYRWLTSWLTFTGL